MIPMEFLLKTSKAARRYGERSPRIILLLKDLILADELLTELADSRP